MSLQKINSPPSHGMGPWNECADVGGPLTVGGRKVISGIKAKSRRVLSLVWAHTKMDNDFVPNEGVAFCERENYNIFVCGI